MPAARLARNQRDAAFVAWRPAPMTPAQTRRMLGALRVLGWFLIALALGLLVREMYAVGAVAEGRRLFLWIDIGLFVVGFWLIAPMQASALITRVGTYLPVIGGRRTADRNSAEQVAVVASELPPDQHAQAVVEEIIGPATSPHIDPPKPPETP